jgi:hypothetical protein
MGMAWRYAAAFHGHRAIVVVLVLASALYVPLTWSGELASLGGDAAIYLLSARHYAPWLPADSVAEAFATHSQFPPVYPLLLTLSGGAVDLAVAHAVTTLSLLAAFAALYAWQIQLGLGRGWAAVITALFAAMPGTFVQSLYLHSENLYLALTLAALALLTSAVRTRDSSLFWAATAVTAAAVMTRTVGVSLLPALAVVIVRCRPRGWPVMLLASIAPALAWSVWHTSEWSYSDSLAQRYAGAPLETILGHLTANAAATGWGLARNVLVLPSLLWTVVLLGVLALPVAIRRFCGGEPDAWYLGAYLAILVIWPYPDESRRFTWVLVPLLTVYAGLAATQLLGQTERLSARVKRGIPLSLMALLALIVGPELALSLQRAAAVPEGADPAMRHLPEWYGAEPRESREKAELHLAMVRALQDFGTEIPGGECVLSINPAVVAFHSGHDSSIPPPEEVDDVGFGQQLAAQGCRYIVLLAARSPTFPTTYYPLERLGQRAEVISVHRLETGSAQGRVVAGLARLTP